MDLIKLIRRDGTSSLYVVKSYELILQELEKGDDYKKMLNKFSDEVRKMKEEAITEEEMKYQEKVEDYQSDQIFQHLIEDQGFDPDDLNGHFSGGHTVTQGWSHHYPLNR